jgi:succinate dehydrogenase / fumarate reductase cytochrome b subunit
MQRANRPLSPHLSIYRPQITSFTSIMHRATGFFLALGCLLLVSWLWAAAYNHTCYGGIVRVATSWYGQLVLIGWSWAFFYHLLNGIRHLFWDIGKGFEIKTAERSGWLAVISSVVVTAILWGYVWGVGL